MDKIFVNIITVPILSYFQPGLFFISLQYSPYIIYNYLWIFSKNLVIFCYFTLGYFFIFLSYFWFLKKN